MAGAGDPRSAAEYERMLGCLAGEQYVFVDVANLVGQEAQADVYVMRQKTGRCSPRAVLPARWVECPGTVGVLRVGGRVLGRLAGTVLGLSQVGTQI